MFPRFMRWDIGALVTRIRGLDVSTPGKFEVRIERMKSLEFEREILATDEQEVGCRDDGVKDVVFGSGDGMQRATHQVVDGVGVKGKDVGSVERDAVNEVSSVTELENALKCMADLELKNKAYEGTISKLEDEVVSLKSKMEMQAVNIVGGFGCVVKVKDDEIRKLENENKELRQTISLLEDQLADQQVHTVTQAYRMNTPTGCGDVGASHCDVDSGFGVTVVHDVTPIRVGLNVGVGGDNVTCTISILVRCQTVVLLMAVMWSSRESGVAVYFTDVKSLVRGESICGNVIDAYAETLVTEQANVCAGDVLADKSYFFSSICMSVFKSGNNQAVESYVLKNFGASKECRYIHFPICNNAHWTLVVYDAEDGSWKHFNPMRQRSAGRSDVHYNEALVLKERVSVVMKRSLRADGIDEVSIAETFNHPLEAVEDCPQQKADS
ncbi:hypothetical protein LOK49_Contig148G00001 [Camellia lanceoleosa]|nr:hypothetical protein LOK49_Contig148G00001 [Camellia lanceoleosa]